jgi:hypothetical protein
MNDPVGRHGLDWGRDIVFATFAADDEGVRMLGHAAHKTGSHNEGF